MTVSEFGKKLREMYEIKGANKVAMVHLFGIIYADQMNKAGIKPLEVAIAAQISESYWTEINKGKNLARYVELKPEYAGKF